jgi:hypothetical protein
MSLRFPVIFYVKLQSRHPQKVPSFIERGDGRGGWGRVMKSICPHSSTKHEIENQNGVLPGLKYIRL